jgi:ferredoxin--NADP+ reductase
MYRILERRDFTPRIKLFRVAAPLIAERAEPGHFVIVRIDDRGERIPLTIADYDKQEGTITLVVQEIGKTTCQFGSMEVGQSLRDVVGPLGTPVRIEKVGTVVCVAGGLGVAPIYPKARALAEVGNRVISLIGARSESELFFTEEMAAVSEYVRYSTDDGSFGHHGFVTDLLKEVLQSGSVDEVIAVGPLPMMKAACSVTRESNVPTIVSLNAIMVDGTGMCGSCRVTVGGEVKFSCVDGPAFDGHQVDFDELMMRNRRFLGKEKTSMEAYHHEGGNCRCQKR